MTFSALLDRTTRLYRTNFRPLVTTTAILSVVNLPLALLTPTPSSGRPSSQWVVSFAVMMVAALLVSPLNFGSLSHMSLQILKGEPIFAREALRAAVSRYGTLLLAWFIAMALSGIGFVFLVIPGIYIMLGCSLISMVVMGEGLGARPAFKRSWALMRGRRLRVMGLFLVWAVLQLVTNYALSGVLRLVAPDGIAAVLGQQIASIFVAPCWALSLALVFEQAKLDREGHDLILEAQRLAGPHAPSDPNAPLIQSAR